MKYISTHRNEQVPHGLMQSSMSRRSLNLPIPTPTGRHNPLYSQDTSSTMSKTRETNFRLPEEWEAQEILEEEVVGKKTYYLISWKPTLVPETEVSTTLLQTWRDEMDNLVVPNHDSVLESHVVLQRCDQWLGTIIGEEVLDGATHYRVQWEPTFEPDSNRGS
ncbi:atp-dependent rna helicase dbp7 protein [Apiospora arundinis]